MNDLLFARSQMAMSLGFHIIFAVIGIGMPALMVIAEWRWLRTGNAVLLDLARRWSRGTSIMFAVGAVSGTVLSFELGLLWPGFMEYAGGIIGMPFSLEGLAFFTEAIFLGIYLFAWDRISPRAHLFAGILVAVSGALSGAFVVCANAWMNGPAGFSVIDGVVTDVQPMVAMFNPAAGVEVVHMTFAAFAATGFAVAGVHAFALLKRTSNKEFHRAALQIALVVGVPAAMLQPISGDWSARVVGRLQPVKLAAMEGHMRTGPAALVIGGWPDTDQLEMRGAIEIPGAISLLMKGDRSASIPGLDAVSPDDRPPVPIVHIAFQTMVACGIVLSLIGIWTIVRALLRRRGRGKPLPDDRWFLRAIITAAPLGFVAIEAGWTVTEVGRQPWIIQGFMRTADAVTPMPGLWISFALFTALYIGLAIAVIFLLRRQIARTVVT